jgi:hypothetical protein
MEPDQPSYSEFPADVKRHILSFWDGEAYKLLLISMATKEWQEIFSDSKGKIWTLFFEKYKFSLVKDHVYPSSISPKDAFSACAKARKNMADRRACVVSLLSSGLPANAPGTTLETNFINGSSRFFAYRIMEAQGWGSYSTSATLESQLLDLSTWPSIKRVKYLDTAYQSPMLGKYLLDQPSGIARMYDLEAIARRGNNAPLEANAAFPPFKPDVDPPTHLIGNQDPTNPWVVAVCGGQWDAAFQNYTSNINMFNVQTKKYVPMETVAMQGKTLLSGFHLLINTTSSLAVLLANVSTGKFEKCLSLDLGAAFEDEVAEMDSSLSPDATLGLLVRFSLSNQSKRSLFTWSMKEEFDQKRFLATRLELTLGFPQTSDHLILMAGLAFAYRNEDVVVIDYNGKRTLATLRFPARVTSVGAIDSTRFIVSTARDAIFIDFANGNPTYPLAQIPLVVKDCAVLRRDKSVQLTSWDGNFEGLRLTLSTELNCISSKLFKGGFYPIFHTDKRGPVSAIREATAPTLSEFLMELDHQYQKPLLCILREEDIANETDPTVLIKKMTKTHSRTGNRARSAPEASKSTKQGLVDMDDLVAVIFKVTEVGDKLTCTSLSLTDAKNVLEIEFPS